MAYLMAKKAGPRAKVLRHRSPLPGAERRAESSPSPTRQCWVVSISMTVVADLDRPLPIFRIFHEIHAFAVDSGKYPDIAYIVDQSHNLNRRSRRRSATVVGAVGQGGPGQIAGSSGPQNKGDIVSAENLLTASTDVPFALEEEESTSGHPLLAHRRSGYEAAAKERTQGTRHRPRRHLVGVARSLLPGPPPHISS